MPNTYTPSDVALTTVTEPVDTEPRTVASVTQMTRALADGIKHLSNQILDRIDVITASGTWTPGAGTTDVVVYGYGGGGGGGMAPINGLGTTDTWSSGGGGGGAALAYEVPVVVVPATPITTTIGAGGVAPTTGNPGGTGGDTTFGALAKFTGAQGGQSGGGGTTASTANISPGGAPLVPPLILAAATYTVDATNIRLPVVGGPGFGGEGCDNQAVTNASSKAGWRSVQGYTGGAAGATVRLVPAGMAEPAGTAATATVTERGLPALSELQRRRIQDLAAAARALQGRRRLAVAVSSAPSAASAGVGR